MNKYFGLWSSIAEIERDFGVTYMAAAAFVRRGEIPRIYDAQTLEILRRRGYSTEFRDLDAWHVAHKLRRSQIKSGDVDRASPGPLLPLIEPSDVQSAATQ